MKWINDIDFDKFGFLLIILLIAMFCVSVTSCTMSANGSAERLLNAGKTAAEVNCAIYRGQDLDEACLAAGLSAK